MSLDTGTQLDELYYTISARTQGIAEAKQDVANLATFLEGHPIAVAGALGTALLAIGEKATTMAEAVDASARRVAAVIPGAAGSLNQLKAAVDNAADATGRLHDEVQAAGEVIAHEGVASVEAYADRLALVVKAGDASGSSLDGLATGMASVQNEFHLGNDELEATTAKLFALTQGKASLDGLFEALAHSAPGIHDLGLDFDTAAKALTTLILQGDNTRQAASALQGYAQLGQEGKDAVVALAAEAPKATDALATFNDAAITAEGGIDRLSNRIKNDLDKNMVSLGDHLAPLKQALLTFVDESIADFTGGLPAEFATHARIVQMQELAQATAITTAKLKEMKDVDDALSRTPLIGGLVGIAPSQPPPAPPTPTGPPVKTPQQIQAERALADAKTSLADVQRSVSDAVASIDGEATSALATVSEGFGSQLAQLDAQLEEKYRSLLANVAKANADAIQAQRAGVQGAVETTAAQGVSALADFQQAAAKIRAAAIAKNDYQEQIADVKNLQAAEDAAAVAQLRASGQSAAADQLEAANREKAYEVATLQLAINDKLGVDAAERIVTLSRETFAATQAAQAAERSRQADADLTNAQVAADAAALRAKGELHDANILEISENARLAEQALQQAVLDGKLTQAEADAQIKQVERLAGIQIGGELQGAKNDAAALRDALAQAGENGADLLASVGLIGPKLQQDVKGAIALGASLSHAIGTLGDPSASIVDKVQAVGSVIASASTLLGSLLGGESEAQKQQAAREVELTNSIDHLRSAFQSYTEIVISGKAATALASSAVLSTDVSRPTPGGLSPVKQQLQDLGVSLDDFNAEADSLHITIANKLNPSVLEFNNVVQASRFQEFTAIAKTFAGQLTVLQTGFKILGTSNTDQFAQTVKLLTDKDLGAPAIFDALSGIDVSTVAGAKQASDAIADILKKFTDHDYSNADFGQLDPQQFFDALTGLEGLIPAQAAAGTATDQLAAKLNSLKQGFAVFGTTAVDQVNATLQTLANAGSDQLKAALSGLDASTADGRAAILAKLRDLYQQVTDGYGNTLDLGAVSADNLADAIQLLTSSFDDAGDAAKAASDEASRLATQNQKLADLNVRNLRDAGNTSGADAADRQEQYQSELAQATADGLDAATIAQIKLTQANDEAAAVAAEYVTAQNNAADATKAAAQAADDLAKQQQQLQESETSAALTRIKNQFDLFGITDSLQQVTELVAVLQQGAPIFSQLLGGIDLSDSAGRAQALSSLQTYFLNNPGGQASGTFSADQVQQEVLDVAQLLKSAGVAGTDTTTGTNSSFEVNQQITTVQADRMGGLLSSLVEIDSEQLDVMKHIDSILSAAYPTIGVPSLPSTPSLVQSVTPTTAGTTVIQLTINGTTFDASSTFSADTQQSIRVLGQQIVREVRRQQAGA